MSFTLSIIKPPTGDAQFGKASVESGFGSMLWAATRASVILTGAGSEKIQAYRVGDRLSLGHLGTFVHHEGTGLTFRIDAAESAPHPCPCEDDCGRLVLPTDHPYADAEDAYCLGCFTWDRNTPACLPENTAHAKLP